MRRLRIERMYHGNIKVNSIDADFADSSDYKVLETAAQTFKDLLDEGDRAKETSVQDFHRAMLWLREEAERGVSKQRYKGLGEMNPEQL